MTRTHCPWCSKAIRTVRDWDHALEEDQSIACICEYCERPILKATVREAMRALELRWADRLNAVAREFVSVENKFAMNGAYASAAEQAAYRHGIERSAWLIRNRPDEEE